MNIEKNTQKEQNNIFQAYDSHSDSLNKWTIVYVGVYALIYEDPSITEGPSLELDKENVKPKNIQFFQRNIKEC